jgi:hypothetical protein
VIAPAAEEPVVIFLDVDGVLNSAATTGQQWALETPLLSLLAQLLDRCPPHHTRIVVSSTWRLTEVRPFP